MALEVEILNSNGDDPARYDRAARAALQAAGVGEGHLAVDFVDEATIQRLNADHRGRDSATDVLSFPIDEDEAIGPRELGDVLICVAHTRDVREAVVHGVLHLTGMDHETDEGEMLAVQAEILAW